MRTKKVLVFFFGFFILGFSICVRNWVNAQDFHPTFKSASSNTIFAESLSRADIQTAVDSASPGDTVILPPGTNSYYSGSVTISTPNIHVRGQGKSITRIELGQNQDGRNYPMFDIQADNVEFSNIALIAYLHDDSWSVCLRVNYSTEFKIHDCEFREVSFAAIWVRGYPSDGVIWDCDFIDGPSEGLGYGVAVFAEEDSEASGYYGEASWGDALALGTVDGVYIEDCTFSNFRHCVTGQSGGRFVCRYCTLYADSTLQPEEIFDTHGVSQYSRGARKYEIYENTVIRSEGGNLWFAILYAGDGVIFNNTVTGFTEIYKFLYLGLSCCNANNCGDYPEQDQTRDLYIWGNSVNEIPYNSAIEVNACNNDQDHPYFQKDRDWFDYPKPEYTPLAYPHPMRQEAGPSIGLSTTSLKFNAMVGGSSPSNQTIRIANTGGGLLDWSVNDNVDWLVCSPNSGQEYAELTVSVNTANFAVGTYNAAITVTSPYASNSPQNISVSLTIFPPTSKLAISSSTGSPAPGLGGTTDPAPGVYSYTSGSNVQVNALHNPSYRFSHWTGDVNSSWAFNEEITVYMNADKSVAANFCTKCGDVTGDLSITPGDAQRVFDIYLGKGANATPCELENADVNCDGTKNEPYITPGDAQRVFENYLGISELLADCSGNSRSESALSIMKKRTEKINLIIDVPQQVSDNVVIISIIIDNPYDIKAFGFDFCFPSEVLEYVTIERTEFTELLDEVDTNILRDGILRIGGYKSVPILSRFPVLITLVFKVIGEVKDHMPITIINTVDDIKNSNVKPGIITKEINQSKHKEIPVIK